MFLKEYLNREYFEANSHKLWHKVYPIVNLICIALIQLFTISMNAGFCVFVGWAAVLQVVAYVHLLSYSIVWQTRFKHVSALVSGVATCWFVYWLVYFEFEGLLFPFVLMTIWFIVQLFWRGIVSPLAKGIRLCYIAGVAVSVFFAWQWGAMYASAAKNIESGSFDSGNPMTERIVGMHFKYHTRLCIFDGWRPPYHDPAIVIGMRLNGDSEPLSHLSLADRVILYHSLYPMLPVVADCACSNQSEYEGYFTDTLWTTLW